MSHPLHGAGISTHAAGEGLPRHCHARGSIEQWLARAVKSGRLGAARLHAVAARVLERPVTGLWPLTKA